MAAQPLQNEDCVMAPLLGWFLFMHDMVNPCRSSSTRSDLRLAMQCEAPGLFGQIELRCFLDQMLFSTQYCPKRIPDIRHVNLCIYRE
jgi:hypothetical protein